MAANVVDTDSGKVSGVTSDGVHVFKGIPYGASTAAANRFMPPKKAAPWNGVRDCIAYAGRSPQAAAAAQRPELATVWGAIDTLPVGEDCLTLHVWTPGLDNAKRPVMVWLHGGAFSYGSANSPRYDGTRLAARNDAVVVAVNHRLNIFGHLDLSSLGGERFARSGNVGALEWVRDHAARFGGDPANVTIFGQSGGGGKVCALLAMPQAKGLFHKAIVQSGSSVRFAERERTAQLADAVLKQLGLGKDQLDTLQALPAAELSKVIAPAQKTLPKPRYPLLDRYNFGPVIDGTVLPAQPFEPATPVSDDIPVMVGGTKDESAIFMAPDDAIWNRALTDAELHKRIEAIAGGAADPILAYYSCCSPKANAAERFITATTASNFGVRGTLLAERKAARAKAPVWMYEFAWETPAFDGKLKSCHSIEVPFVFDTLKVIGERHHKPGAQALADKVSKTWATFARTGKADWAPYTADRRTTMVFNDDSKTIDDPDKDVRPLWTTVATA
ncbi:MAG: carboxylesterase/lipase family protein [Reyranella sp.]|uniref:carboxylesterase/lipase family protein n=1 Tax=Reyranella sp. TaxID=1929291 RepID=UPI001AC2F227|nr:carboxylesterase family protein [Reyranella sp.]MBN9087055.1 carboxylesterase/lipase family protein [Reyranella sp.]